MKTDKNLKEFIEYLKNTSPEIPADTVKSLIDSGKSSPFVAKRSFQPRRIKKMFNPLKNLIMIAPIVILTSVLLTLNQESQEISGNPNDKVQFVIPQIKIENITDKKEALSKDSTHSNQIYQVRESSLRKVQETPDVCDTAREPDNILGLSSDVFRCLGFTFNQGGFSYIFRFHWDWIKFNFGGPEKEGVFPATGLENQIDSMAPVVYLLSGPSSQKLLPNNSSPGILFGISPLDGMVDGTPLNAVIDLCLPIRIVDSTLPKKIQEYIFWVYPNERFFQCLPSETSNSLRQEFNYQKQRLSPGNSQRLRAIDDTTVGIRNTDTRNLNASIITDTVVQKWDSSKIEATQVPCVYYTNLCETLSGLDYVNLYPNPATDKLNVDLVLQKAKKIQFRVFDLGGRLISDEGSPENYPEGGQFKYQLDISKLQPGLYL
ncbi:MAG: T9SS type A sorting domain-containing protein, partial [Bacteroidales bacterium]|nr:T9SS type A sorting domain-containing protein [Bacteroidales bacterium]